MKNNSFLLQFHRLTEGIEKQDLHVVGIGASAGGLEDIEQFFANMPFTKWNGVYYCAAPFL